MAFVLRFNHKYLLSLKGEMVIQGRKPHSNLYASLTDILGTDKSHMVECTAGAIFCLSKPDIKILIRRGENVLRRKS